MDHRENGKSETEKIDIEALLREGKHVQLSPRGYSMYPLLIQDRDQVVIAPVSPEKIRRGDCVLYRREGSILVLHRVYAVRREGLVFTGDNQTVLEGPLPFSCVRGIMTHFIRKGRRYSVNHVVYRMYGGLWLLMFPIRKPIMKLVSGIKRLVRR